MHTPELVEAAHDVLSQGLKLLIDLDDRCYSRPAGVPYHASIGQHYRHVVEHFQCLIAGLRAAEINYDARARNPRLENEVSYASVTTCDVLRALKSYDDGVLGQNCKIVHTAGYTSSRPVLLDSNVGRELAYCVGHAVHHYAIIRLIGHETGVPLAPEFGIAPSTLKSRSALAAS